MSVGDRQGDGGGVGGCQGQGEEGGRSNSAADTLICSD